MPRSSPFDAYVGNAAEGPNSLPRILLAGLLIVAVWVVGTLVALVVGAALAVLWSGEPSPSSFNGFMSALERSRLWVPSLLLSVTSLWLGLGMALRLVHRRRLSGLYGVGHRVDKAQFRQGLAAGLIVAIVSVFVGLLIDPEISATGIDPLMWLAVLPFMLVVIFAQSSAEELLFRGYLMQALAGRFRSPWVWALVPTLLFASIHWNPAATFHMNLAGLASIAALAVALALLVWKTGNLGAAFGAHTGNNIVALLFVAPEADYGPLSLFRVRSMSEAGWTVPDAVWSTITGLAMAALLAALLLHRRSPLRVGTAAAFGQRQAATGVAEG